MADNWRENNYYKFGKTGDIDVRMAQYRTSMPHSNLKCLVYTNDHEFLETLVKKRFLKYLCESNREYIANVALKCITDMVATSAKKYNLEATFETREELEMYNKTVDNEYYTDVESEDDIYSEGESEVL